MAAIDLNRVQREATPRLLPTREVQLDRIGLRLPDAVSVLEIFGGERARSTVHNWG